MQHPIDPKVDCVFKALLGAPENRDLLMHFLNAILEGELTHPIVQVEITDPHNARETLVDKLSIVDVKATDSHGRIFQIEVQMQSFGHLPHRIAYTWCDIYSAQLRSGQDYPQLLPTYSIWLLAENLIPEDESHVHNYKLRDERGRLLLDNGGIYLLELEKFRREQVESDGQRWIKFFKDGERLDDAALPNWMNTPEMRKAMSVLRQFSEKEQQYHEYQARLNFLRQQRTIRWEYEQQLALEREEKEEALRREELARQEIERLRAMLARKETD